MHQNQQTPNDTKIEVRHVVMPHQANPNGFLFGGVILAWVDMAAAIVAEKYTRKTVATVHIDSVTFSKPMKVGNHAFIQAKVQYVGNTSLVVRVTVMDEDPRTGKSALSLKTDITFVALDDANMPVSIPPLFLNSLEEEKIAKEIEDKIKQHKKGN